MPKIDLDALEAMRAALDALTIGSGKWIEAWERYADTSACAAPALIAAARERDALKAALKQAVEALEPFASTCDFRGLSLTCTQDDLRRARAARAALAALQETKP